MVKSTLDVPDALRRRVLDAVAWLEAANRVSKEFPEDPLATANLAAAVAEGRRAKAALEEWL